MNDAFVFHGARVSAANTVEVCWRDGSDSSVNPSSVPVWVIERV